MDDQLKKVFDRVQKLLSLANNNPNENEAAAAAAMAARMMKKYQIDHADLVEEELKTKNGSVIRDMMDDPRYKVRLPLWYTTLGINVARVMDCHVRTVMQSRSDPSPVFAVYGYDKDVQVTKWLFKYVLEQIEKLCTKSWNEVGRVSLLNDGKAVNPSTTRRWKDNYRFGAVCRVIETIEQVYAKETEPEDAKDSTPSQETTGSALVELKQALITEKFGEFHYNIKEKQFNKASLLGNKDGASVVVNKIVESDEERPLLIGR